MCNVFDTQIKNKGCSLSVLRTAKYSSELVVSYMLIYFLLRCWYWSTTFELLYCSNKNGNGLQIPNVFFNLLFTQHLGYTTVYTELSAVELICNIFVKGLSSSILTFVISGLRDFQNILKYSLIICVLYCGLNTYITSKTICYLTAFQLQRSANLVHRHRNILLYLWFSSNCAFSILL